MYQGLLPIGSIVLLKNSTKRCMITGLCQKDGDGELHDYCGVVWPEGYAGAQYGLLFSEKDIDIVYQVGYQDPEQFRFKAQADEAWGKMPKTAE